MRRSLMCLLAGLTLFFAAQAGAQELMVSAAASLSQVLPPLAREFEARHQGSRLIFNFAASGALAQQIAKGAPVNVFISADQESMDLLQTLGLLKDNQRLQLLRNQLVLVQAPDAAQPLQKLQDLRDPKFERIAIGSPASVPAGRYARAALEKAGLWNQVQGRLIYAQNVRQVVDYVARGEVQAGFVYASDARQFAARLKNPVPVALDKPVLYPAAVLAGSARAQLGQDFLRFLQSAAAQAEFAKAGFSQP